MRSQGHVILFPDFEKLKDEVEKLKTELSMLVLERDELRFVLCKNIETQYMFKLGGIEYRAYEAQCAALRLKRKIEMLQARKNRREKIILADIEHALDREFAEYQNELDERMRRMNDALLRSQAKWLSEKDAKELKRLYRLLVRLLHPDMNPDESKERLRLFENAVTAYKNGDLAALRIIYEMVGGNPSPRDDRDALSQLAEAKKRLQASIQDVRDSIREIQSEYPYTMKPLIEDEEKLSQRKKELEEVLQQYKDLIEIYRTRIEEMLR